MINPIKRAEELTRVVSKGDLRKYYRFRPARFYGGIATAACGGQKESYISHRVISMRQELGAMPAACWDVSLEEVSRLTHPPRSVL